MDFKNWLEQENDKLLILMRGISGSGKSTTARQIAAGRGVIFSTDDYMEGEDLNDYRANFDMVSEKGLLPHLHKMNQERTAQAMKSGISPIIVDNTNVEKWHMEPYVKLAKDYGYRVEFAMSPYMEELAKLLEDQEANHLKLRIAARQLAKRNLHGIPPDRIMNQLEKWHPDPKIEDFS